MGKVVILFVLGTLLLCIFFARVPSTYCQSSRRKGATTLTWKDYIKPLEGVGICINVSEQKYNDTLKNTPRDWGYFYYCDSSAFKIYTIVPADALSLFIVEIHENRGSGEYYNIVVRRTAKGYERVQEFHGYIKEVADRKNTSGVNDLIMRVKPENDMYVDLLGEWNGSYYYTHSILGIECNNGVKLQSYMDWFYNNPIEKRKWE